MRIPSSQDIAFQFINENRTKIDTPSAYPQYQLTAELLAGRLSQIPNPTSGLMAGQLLWFRDEFSKWNPENEPTDEKRSRILTEFMQLLREYWALVNEFEKAATPIADKIIR